MLSSLIHPSIEQKTSSGTSKKQISSNSRVRAFNSALDWGCITSVGPWIVEDVSLIMLLFATVYWPFMKTASSAEKQWSLSPMTFCSLFSKIPHWHHWKQTTSLMIFWNCLYTKRRQTILRSHNAGSYSLYWSTLISMIRTIELSGVTTSFDSFFGHKQTSQSHRTYVP